MREARREKGTLRFFGPFSFSVVGGWFSCCGIFFTDFSEWVFARGELTVLMLLGNLGFV